MPNGIKCLADMLCSDVTSGGPQILSALESGPNCDELLGKKN